MDWQKRREQAKQDVLDWVAKYDTGNDPECLKFLLEAHKSHCQVEEDYEAYLAGLTEPLNDWRHVAEIGAYFRVRAGDSFEYHQVTRAGFVTDENNKDHPISQCQFGFWTQEEIDKATQEAAITRKWLFGDGYNGN